MDERDRQFRRDTWSDMDRGWAMTVELLTATFVWMGIGWLVDRWLGISPWGMLAGAVLGSALGMYLVFLRADEQGKQEEAKRPRL
jgi:ATP synthase protein I